MYRTRHKKINVIEYMMTQNKSQAVFLFCFVFVLFFSGGGGGGGGQNTGAPHNLTHNLR